MLTSIALPLSRKETAATPGHGIQQGLTTNNPGLDAVRIFRRCGYGFKLGSWRAGGLAIDPATAGWRREGFWREWEKHKSASSVFGRCAAQDIISCAAIPPASPASSALESPAGCGVSSRVFPSFYPEKSFVCTRVSSEPTSRARYYPNGFFLPIQSRALDKNNNNSCPED